MPVVVQQKKDPFPTVAPFHNLAPGWFGTKRDLHARLPRQAAEQLCEKGDLRQGRKVNALPMARLVATDCRRTGEEAVAIPVEDPAPLRMNAFGK